MLARILRSQPLASLPDTGPAGARGRTRYAGEEAPRRGSRQIPHRVARHGPLGKGNRRVGSISWPQNFTLAASTGPCLRGCHLDLLPSRSPMYAVPASVTAGAGITDPAWPRACSATPGAQSLAPVPPAPAPRTRPAGIQAEGRAAQSNVGEAGEVPGGVRRRCWAASGGRRPRRGGRGHAARKEGRLQAARTE